MATVLLGAGGALFLNYWSPKNTSRPNIQKAQYIILHTTEGGATGSLQKLWSRGEAHFMVDTDGTVYRLMKTDKLAKHAGRSLWNGLYDLDRYSIGIEVVGYHDVLPTDAQVNSLSGLLSNLRTQYSIDDDHVLTHSMVAYGTPDRWHHFDHRGRKDCGMLFGTSALRARLGLRSKPLFDPDVAAGRMKFGDKDLAHLLYGSDAVEEESAYTKKISSQKVEDVAENPSEPDGFQKIGPDHPTAYSIAGHDYAKSTTIYFFPSMAVRTGEQLSQTAQGQYTLAHLPTGTTMLIGYVYGGSISMGRLPNRIAKNRWNYPSTYYRLPSGEMKSGDDIVPQSIPQGTLIFFQQ